MTSNKGREETKMNQKHIVITGKLISFGRDEAFIRISERGWIPQKNVTQKTDTLVVGSYWNGQLRGDKSNSLIKAERYICKGQKIAIITDEEFMKML